MSWAFMWVGAACVKQSGQQLDLLRPGERKTSLSRADPTYPTRDQGEARSGSEKWKIPWKFRSVLLKGTEMGLQEQSNYLLDWSDCGSGLVQLITFQKCVQWIPVSPICYGCNWEDSSVLSSKNQITPPLSQAVNPHVSHLCLIMLPSNSCCI